MGILYNIYIVELQAKIQKHSKAYHYKHQYITLNFPYSLILQRLQGLQKQFETGLAKFKGQKAVHNF